MLKRNLKVILLIGIFAAFAIGAISFLSPKKKEEKDEETKPTTKEVKKDIKNAKLTLVGDFLFEQPFYDATNYGKNANTYFTEVNKYFKNDDLTIGNMEVVIGNDSLETSGNGYNFCAPKSIGDLVSSLDLEVLSTANNHSNDRGFDGVKSTIDYFKNNTDILTVGTYKSKEDKEKPVIFETNGIKFGFISYTLGTNIRLTDNLFSVNIYRDPNTKKITDSIKNEIKADVDRLKENNVDVIMALIHWGTEFTNDPSSEQNTLADYLNSLGVDIIVGNHSHCIQPIKWIGDDHKTLVFYSLGNFVSADNDIERTGEKFDNAYQFGLLANLVVTKENDNITITDIETEPIINYYDTNMQNFKLIPYNIYTSEYEESHYRYKYNFNKEFITNMYNTVIDKEFRND